MGYEVCKIIKSVSLLSSCAVCNNASNRQFRISYWLRFEAGQSYHMQAQPAMLSSSNALQTSIAANLRVQNYRTAESCLEPIT